MGNGERYGNSICPLGRHELLGEADKSCKVGICVRSVLLNYFKSVLFCAGLGAYAADSVVRAVTHHLSGKSGVGVFRRLISAVFDVVGALCQRFFLGIYLSYVGRVGVRLYRKAVSYLHTDYVCYVKVVVCHKVIGLLNRAYSGVFQRQYAEIRTSSFNQVNHVLEACHKADRLVFAEKLDAGSLGICTRSSLAGNYLRIFGVEYLRLFVYPAPCIYL